MANVDVKQSIRDIANRYAELLKKEMNIKNIYLFGSYTKGNFTEDSDIDIIVISEEFSGDPVNDTLRLMKIRRKVDNRIEPHPFKVEDFDESTPYVKEILKQAIKVA